ncbi:MAG: lasso peptide biosynthesis B2 protein [Phormidesmis sp.]
MNKLTLMQCKFWSFWNLELSSRRLLGRSLALFPLVALSLKCLGLKRTQTALLGFVPAPMQSEHSETGEAAVVAMRVAATVRMVRIAATYYQPWANCLKKSLVLWSLLRQQGIYSEVKVGVRRSEGHFEAHA